MAVEIIRDRITIQVVRGLSSVVKHLTADPKTRVRFPLTPNLNDPNEICTYWFFTGKCSLVSVLCTGPVKEPGF